MHLFQSDRQLVFIQFHVRDPRARERQVTQDLTTDDNSPNPLCWCGRAGFSMTDSPQRWLVRLWFSWRASFGERTPAVSV